MKNLRYSLISAYKNGVDDHAQRVIKQLGITYTDCEPVPIADAWLFYGCENVPENLPDYIEEF